MYGTTTAVSAHMPKLADWVQHAQPSMLHGLARMFDTPDLISFGGGIPDPALHPDEALAEAAAYVTRHQTAALQYGRDNAKLKAQIVEIMKLRGVDCTPSQINITVGSQHAVHILAHLFCNPGDTIALESVVYTGIWQNVGPLQPNVCKIPPSSHGSLDLDYLEQKLIEGVRPRFLYVIPDGHNPLAYSLTDAERQRLANLARQYQMPVIEDDPYGFLTYSDDAPPALYAYDSDWFFYAGTFSKVVAPGYRLGWTVSSEAMAAKIQMMKIVTMLSTNPFAQFVVSRYLETADFPAHLQHIRAAYKERRDTMLDAMAEHFPAGVTWNEPDAGLFIWVTLPDGMDAFELVQKAVDEVAVAYIPGRAFAGVGETRTELFQNQFRLSFSRDEPRRIVEGIARLGRLLKQELAAQ